MVTACLSPPGRAITREGFIITFWPSKSQWLKGENSSSMVTCRPFSECSCFVEPHGNLTPINGCLLQSLHLLSYAVPCAGRAWGKRLRLPSSSAPMYINFELESCHFKKQEPLEIYPGDSASLGGATYQSFEWWKLSCLCSHAPEVSLCK